MSTTRTLGVLLLAVSLASACSSSPTAPSAPPPPPPPPPPTTGVLTVRIDAACAGVHVLSADVFIDGQHVGVAAAGGSYAQTVSIGQHNVEATAYYANGVQGTHWGPYSVSVPAAGFTELFYCN